MPFSGIANSDQLNMLTAVLYEHCREHGIADKEEQDDVARILMSLYSNGISSPKALKAALASSIRATGVRTPTRDKNVGDLV